MCCTPEFCHPWSRLLVDRACGPHRERRRYMNNVYISKQQICMSCQHTLTPLTPRRDYFLASVDCSSTVASIHKMLLDARKWATSCV